MGCWVNPGETQKTWANILSSHSEPPRRGVSFEQRDNSVNLIGLQAGTGADWAHNSNFQVQLTSNKWNHIVAVRSGGITRWYQDGELVSEQPFIDGSTKSSP